MAKERKTLRKGKNSLGKIGDRDSLEEKREMKS